MSDAIICDRCDKRIDDEWTGPMFRVQNHTGVGPRKWDLCPECLSDIQDEIWPLLRGESNE